MSQYGESSFRDLCVPGTHNSSTSSVDTRNALQSQYGRGVLSSLRSLFPSFFREWTSCQHLSVYEQCEIGVRCFDVRVSVQNARVVTSHSFACVPLSAVFDELVRFFEAYGTTEIVVLCIKADHSNREGWSATGTAPYTALLRTHRVREFVVPTSVASPWLLHLDQLHRAGTPLILMSSEELLQVPGKTGEAGTWLGVGHPYKKRGRWYNSSTRKDVNAAIDEELAQLALLPSPPSTIYEINAVYTPQTKDVVASAVQLVLLLLTPLLWLGLRLFLRIPTDLPALARYSHGDLWDKIRGHAGRLNVVTVDFVTAEFARRVVEMNRR